MKEYWEIKAIYNGKIQNYKYNAEKLPKIQNVIDRFYKEFSDLNKILKIERYDS